MSIGAVDRWTIFNNRQSECQLVYDDKGRLLQVTKTDDYGQNLMFKQGARVIIRTGTRNKVGCIVAFHPPADYCHLFSVKLLVEGNKSAGTFTAWDSIQLCPELTSGDFITRSTAAPGSNTLYFTMHSWDEVAEFIQNLESETVTSFVRHVRHANRDSQQFTFVDGTCGSSVCYEIFHCNRSRTKRDYVRSKNAVTTRIGSSSKAECPSSISIHTVKVEGKFVYCLQLSPHNHALCERNAAHIL